MKAIPDLSENLKPIFDFEIGRGNHVERVDRPAGSSCPLAVVFETPLDIPGYIERHGLPNGVRTWENKDRHYPVEAGYVCEETRHAISGPIERT